MEDEPPAAEMLAEFIAGRAELGAPTLAGSIAEARRAFAAGGFDLVFLDINLPDGESLAALAEHCKDASVILTTGRPDMALEAFDAGAVDYLLKPITLERFDRAVNRALRYIGARESRPVVFSSETRATVRLPPEDVVYIEACGNYCVVHARSGRFTTRTGLSAFAENLPPGFSQIHRSYIANLDCVESLKREDSGAYSVGLRGETPLQLPVGRKYAAGLRRRIGKTRSAP